MTYSGVLGLDPRDLGDSRMESNCLVAGWLELFSCCLGDFEKGVEAQNEVYMFW